MYFRVNLKMKKKTLCCCFTWIAFNELHFAVAFLLIRENRDGRFLSNIACTIVCWERWGSEFLHKK